MALDLQSCSRVEAFLFDPDRDSGFASRYAHQRAATLITILSRDNTICLHLFLRTLRNFTCHNYCFGLGKRYDICHSLLIFPVFLLIFHQVFYDLLVSQLHVEGVRE